MKALHLLLISLIFSSQFSLSVLFSLYSYDRGYHRANMCFHVAAPPFMWGTRKEHALGTFYLWSSISLSPPPPPCALPPTHTHAHLLRDWVQTVRMERRGNECWKIYEQTCQSNSTHNSIVTNKNYCMYVYMAHTLTICIMFFSCEN